MGSFVRLVIVVGFVVFCNLAALQAPFCLAGNGLAGAIRRGGNSSSSLVLPIRGSVYPDGLFYVTLLVGTPPRPYYLDVDTGSNFTWLQCDAPCVSCSQGPHPPYKPRKMNLVTCNEPQCVALGSLRRFKCERPSQQCDYQIEYIDLSSSTGVLVRDALYLKSANGSPVQSSLAFGCGYDQQSPQPTPVSATDGLLGLANGKSSITSQLKEQGLVRNVIGHCISGHGGVGYLFFGDDLVPSTGVTWIPMHRNPAEKYSPGPANLIYGKQKIKDLMTVFDSGSSYTYFTSRPYQALVSAIRKDLAHKPIKQIFEDITLPLCWQGPKAFTSFSDVENYFRPFTLDFKSSRKARLEIPPENYLIITSVGNVCLGIMNGTEVGLRDFNLIGDIFMQSYMIIYDNEKHQIGWTAASCRLPRMDAPGNRGSIEGAAVNMNILTNRGTPPSATYPPGTVEYS
ncbi:unnamed protein product [Victoria cruziana]